MKPKVLVILGPTATGKSDLAVFLAKKFNGEVISADSRQVYKGMDIGSGKITKKEMRGVPHHLLDVANPKLNFSVDKFQKLGEKKIAEILEHGKMPIICGGTGFYIDTLVEGKIFPAVKENKKLRVVLQKLNVIELLSKLRALDPIRADQIDPHNKVRLIRAIEIALTLGSVPPVESRHTYDPLYIGLDLPNSALQEHIRARLERRLKQGMIAEVGRLHKAGVSYRRLESFGLEYKNCALYLQNKIDKKQLAENILNESFQYAKRQRTWFKRNDRIKWFDPSDKNSRILITKEISNFLQNEK
jgi:tRNA dimethylallyltransferase